MYCSAVACGWHAELRAFCVAAGWGRGAYCGAGGQASGAAGVRACGPKIGRFDLEEASLALNRLRKGELAGAAVLIINSDR